MPRRAAPSTHLIARVRAHYGLLHAELAHWLGVSAATVQGIESGRRGLSAEVLTFLLPLLPHLPPAEAPEADPAADLAADSRQTAESGQTAGGQTAPAPLPPGTTPPDPRPLDVRRRTCLLQAARLRLEVAKLEARATAAHHWALALPALLAHPLLAEVPIPTGPTADAEAVFQAERTQWRRDWAGRQAQPLPAAATTRWCLLAARVAALEAEAAALAPAAGRGAADAVGPGPH